VPDPFAAPSWHNPGSVYSYFPPPIMPNGSGMERLAVAASRMTRAIFSRSLDPCFSFLHADK
jgi:hypothetical protein